MQVMHSFEDKHLIIASLELCDICCGLEGCEVLFSLVIVYVSTLFCWKHAELLLKGYMTIDFIGAMVFDHENTWIWMRFTARQLASVLAQLVRAPVVIKCTRKNAQVVTNLQQTCSNAVPTACQQDVFALLVPSLLTTCYKVVELNRLVTSCSNNLLSSCNSTISQQVHASDKLVATW
jgi:hypothetical protein